MSRPNRINREIKSSSVRLVEQNGSQLGVFNFFEALRLAENKELDLVEINPNASPPVCIITDYGKYLYKKEKEMKENRKNQIQVQVKEIKFRPGTEEHDYQVKLRSIISFINDGNKVKISVRFKGREVSHANLGLELINRVKTDVGDIAKCESFSDKVEGKQLTMILTPS